MLSLFVAALGDDGFAVGVQQRREAAAIAAADIEIVHAGFLVDDDDGVGEEGDAFLFLDVEAIFCHMGNDWMDKYTHFSAGTVIYRKGHRL